MRILLVGATGAAGRRTAAELLRQPEVEHLVLAGRNETAVTRLAHALGRGSNRVGSRTADLTAAGPHDFGGVDVVVSCAGPHYETEEPSVRAAIAAGVSYVSLCDEHAALQEVQLLDREAKGAGVTIVNGFGLSPGITNMLVAHAARELDDIEAIDIALARSSAETNGPASARHFLYELGYEAPMVQDHQPQVAKAGTSPKLVYFPEPVGWVETFRSGHPEVVTLPVRYPALQSLQFRIGLIERITMDTVRAFSATPLVRNERARRTFISATRPLRPLIDRLPPSGPPWTAARVDVKGSKDSNPVQISLGTLDRLLNFASVPLTLAALRLGSGDVAGPGVRMPEEAFDAGRFLSDLVKRGIGIARLEPNPV